MIQIGIGEKNARDRAIAQRVASRLQLRTVFYLSRQVRRSVDQEPPSIIAADGDARLRLRRNPLVARGDAVRTGTIPLRQAATGCAPENTDANRFTPARSDRARVARALEKDRHVFHCGFNPFFLGAFHPGPPFISPTVGACNNFVSIVEQNQWTCWGTSFQFATGRVGPVCGPVGQVGVLACEFG